MPMTFLEYYRENLAHLRSVSAEFAAEFPKIAARLSLSEFECADPYVERLLEGAAARIRVASRKYWVVRAISLPTAVTPSTGMPYRSPASTAYSYRAARWCSPRSTRAS